MLATPPHRLQTLPEKREKLHPLVPKAQGTERTHEGTTERIHGMVQTMDEMPHTVNEMQRIVNEIDHFVSCFIKIMDDSGHFVYGFGQSVDEMRQPLNEMDNFVHGLRHFVSCLPYFVHCFWPSFVLSALPLKGSPSPSEEMGSRKQSPSVSSPCSSGA